MIINCTRQGVVIQFLRILLKKCNLLKLHLWGTITYRQVGNPNISKMISCPGEGQEIQSRGSQVSGSFQGRMLPATEKSILHILNRGTTKKTTSINLLAACDLSWQGNCEVSPKNQACVHGGHQTFFLFLLSQSHPAGERCHQQSITFYHLIKSKIPILVRQCRRNEHYIRQSTEVKVSLYNIKSKKKWPTRVIQKHQEENTC